jgi:hypothetical protein
MLPPMGEIQSCMHRTTLNVSYGFSTKDSVQSFQ